MRRRSKSERRRSKSERREEVEREERGNRRRPLSSRSLHSFQNSSPLFFFRIHAKARQTCSDDLNHPSARGLRPTAAKAERAKKRESSHAALLKPCAFLSQHQHRLAEQSASLLSCALSLSVLSQNQRTNLLIVVVSNSGRHRDKVLQLRRAGRVSGARGRKRGNRDDGR